MSHLGKSAEQRPVGTDWQEHRLKHEDLHYVRFKVVQAVSPPFSFREAAIAWARKQGLIGEMTPAETGNKGRILISVGSLREMLNPVQIGKSCSKQAHFAALSVLRELIREAVIVETYFDRRKGRDGIRGLDNGINTDVLIEVGYAALLFEGTVHRIKLTLKRFADENIPTKAYAYHITKIEVLAGTIGNGLSDTTPNTNTPTTNQAKELPDLTADILLNGVCDVNGESFL